ncbi:hypothetical protein BD410DRAFT_897560 [Rickenella mellea]|uniref:C2H2-type domain-containing protein n=1 Tax=Rickenella mellea TaxID=50990 RepID=A0A4Y7Q795_9AGAM|nr:hypothetical protein BD410DRAFT_897560 [Rickenella mellea]
MLGDVRAPSGSMKRKRGESIGPESVLDNFENYLEQLVATQRELQQHDVRNHGSMPAVAATRSGAPPERVYREQPDATVQINQMDHGSMGRSMGVSGRGHGYDLVQRSPQPQPRISRGRYVGPEPTVHFFDSTQAMPIPAPSAPFAYPVSTEALFSYSRPPQTRPFPPMPILSHGKPTSKVDLTMLNMDASEAQYLGAGQLVEGGTSSQYIHHSPNNQVGYPAGRQTQPQRASDLSRSRNRYQPKLKVYVPVQPRLQNPGHSSYPPMIPSLHNVTSSNPTSPSAVVTSISPSHSTSSSLPPSTFAQQQVQRPNQDTETQNRRSMPPPPALQQPQAQPEQPATKEPKHTNTNVQRKPKSKPPVIPPPPAKTKDIEPAVAIHKTDRIEPARHNKPFVCPRPGCKKSYKQANGLKYHLKLGSCNSILKDRKHSFHCPNPGCVKRYTSAGGLRYHKKKGITDCRSYLDSDSVSSKSYSDVPSKDAEEDPGAQLSQTPAPPKDLSLYDAARRVRSVLTVLRLESKVAPKGANGTLVKRKVLPPPFTWTPKPTSDTSVAGTETGVISKPTPKVPMTPLAVVQAARAAALAAQESVRKLQHHGSSMTTECHDVGKDTQRVGVDRRPAVDEPCHSKPLMTREPLLLPSSRDTIAREREVIDVDAMETVCRERVEGANVDASGSASTLLTADGRLFTTSDKMDVDTRESQDMSTTSTPSRNRPRVRLLLPPRPPTPPASVSGSSRRTSSPDLRTPSPPPKKLVELAQSGSRGRAPPTPLSALRARQTGRVVEIAKEDKGVIARRLLREHQQLAQQLAEEKEKIMRKKQKARVVTPKVTSKRTRRFLTLGHLLRALTEEVNGLGGDGSNGEGEKKDEPTRFAGECSFVCDHQMLSSYDWARTATRVVQEVQRLEGVKFGIHSTEIQELYAKKIGECLCGRVPSSGLTSTPTAGNSTSTAMVVSSGSSHAAGAQDPAQMATSCGGCVEISAAIDLSHPVRGVLGQRVVIVITHPSASCKDASDEDTEKDSDDSSQSSEDSDHIDSEADSDSSSELGSDTTARAARKARLVGELSDLSELSDTPDSADPDPNELELAFPPDDMGIDGANTI